jgi:hypothetical protein
VMDSAEAAVASVPRAAAGCSSSFRANSHGNRNAAAGWRLRTGKKALIACMDTLNNHIVGSKRPEPEAVNYEIRAL